MSEETRAAARAELAKLPGMKELDLRKHTTCAICRQPVFKRKAHEFPGLFWTVKVQRWGLDMEACNRQQGLGMMLGGRGDIARVMGPDEDLAKQMAEAELTVCESCAGEKTGLFELLELAPKPEASDGS